MSFLLRGWLLPGAGTCATTGAARVAAYPMPKKQEAKTNAMRILDQLGVAYEHFTYEVPVFVDAFHTAATLGLDPALMYKTLVTEAAGREDFVFVLPIGAELSLKKAARAAKVKSLAMLALKDLTPVTGYVRGGCTALGMKKKYPVFIDGSALLLEQIVVSGGRLGSQIRLDPEDFARAAGATFADVAEMARS